MNKTLCLITGIPPEKISKGLENAQKYLQNDSARLDVHIQYLTTEMLELPVSAVTEAYWKEPKGLSAALAVAPERLLSRRGRFVIIQSYVRDHVFAIMRGIKSTSSRPGDIIFAMLTETASGWTVTEYLDHLKGEHEYMKSHSAVNDPDMKPM